MAYFEAEDILYSADCGGPEAQSVELSHDITVEMDAEGHFLGVEILNASRFARLYGNADRVECCTFWIWHWSETSWFVSQALK